VVVGVHKNEGSSTERPQAVKTLSVDYLPEQLFRATAFSYTYPERGIHRLAMNGNKKVLHLGMP
jgi:hypothetical protein